MPSYRNTLSTRRVIPFGGADAATVIVSTCDGLARGSRATASLRGSAGSRGLVGTRTARPPRQVLVRREPRVFAAHILRIIADDPDTYLGGESRGGARSTGPSGSRSSSASRIDSLPSNGSAYTAVRALFVQPHRTRSPCKDVR